MAMNTPDGDSTDQAPALEDLLSSATKQRAHEDIVQHLDETTTACPGCEGTGEAFSGVTGGPNRECLDCLPYRAKYGPGRIPVTDRRNLTVRYRHEYVTIPADPYITRVWRSPVPLPRIITRRLTRHTGGRRATPYHFPPHMGTFTKGALEWLSPDEIEAWLRKHDAVKQLRIEAALKRQHAEELRELRGFLLRCAAAVVLIGILTFLLVILIHLYQTAN